MALIILEQLARFALMGGVGFVCVRTHILDDTGLHYLSGLILNVVMPLMILGNVLGQIGHTELIKVIIILPLTALLYALLYCLTWAAARLTGLRGDRSRLFRACGCLGNTGFMGIPLSISIFPTLGALYCGVLSIGDQLFLWTIGFLLTVPEARLRGHRRTENLKLLINPAFISILVAIGGVMLDLHPPTLLMDTVRSLGDCTTPLAMIYLGGLTASLHTRDAFCTRDFYWIVALKMAAVPLVLALAMRWLGVPRDIALFMVVMASTPTMASIAMFAETNGSDSRYAAGAILLTTLFSVFTMPLVIGLAERLIV